MSCISESVPFLTKRKVFDRVMAMRRLQEEKSLICKEMQQHWMVLTHKTSKLEALINEISSKCKKVLIYNILTNLHTNNTLPVSVFQFLLFSISHIQLSLWCFFNILVQF